MRRTSCGMISEALGVDHMEKHGSDCARVGSLLVPNEGSCDRCAFLGIRSPLFISCCQRKMTVAIPASVLICVKSVHSVYSLCTT